MKKQILSFLLLASAALGAEPDWPAVEKNALDLLQRYVRIASINPPADTSATAALLKSELERNGFDVKLFASGPGKQTNLLVRLPGRDRAKKPLLLMNHMDVVPVDAKAWPLDPFGAIVKDGSIWGRGTLDMKGIGVEQIAALCALKQAGIVPSRDIVLLSTADEETGGERGIQWMIQNHFDEIDAEFVLDEGGFGSRDLLTPGRLAFGVAVGEKQLLWLRVTAKGTAGHGSQPIPDNSNVILMNALQQAMNLPASSKQNEVVAGMIQAVNGKLADNKFTAAIQRNTVSLTTLTSGVGTPPKVNVIPSTAEATLDCRLLPGVNAEEFVSDMKARINDPRVSVAVIVKPDDPGASDSGRPLFGVIARALQRQNPGALVTPVLVPYGTDSVKLRKKGITAYGLNPMVLDAATMATMHSDNERIPVAEFLAGIHVFLDVLRSDF